MTQIYGQGRTVITLLCVLICGGLHQCDASGSASQRQAWEAPGCHLVALTAPINIPDCVDYWVPTKGCRGFCESYATPSSIHTLVANPFHVITSNAECCNIVDTINIPHQIHCLDGERVILFKSAINCSCSICRRH